MCRMLELFYQDSPGPVFVSFQQVAGNLIPIADKRNFLAENQILTYFKLLWPFGHPFLLRCLRAI